MGLLILAEVGLLRIGRSGSSRFGGGRGTVRSAPSIPEFSQSLTDGVVALRPWSGADVQALTRACSDPEIQRWTMVPDGYTEADAQAFVQASRERRETGHSVEVAAVNARDPDRVLGAVGLVSIDWRHEHAEVGYWTAPNARQLGVATRALRLLSGWALRELRLARLELKIYLENVRSQRVAEHAGYTREGTLRSAYKSKHGHVDVVMFSMLPRDLDR